jgi:hypothetical protein
LDEAVPATSTSTNSISSRVFAIKIKDKDDDEQQNSNQPYKMVTDSMQLSSSPKELKDFKLSAAANLNQRTVYPSSSLSSSAASSVVSLASSNKRHNHDIRVTPTQTSTILDTSLIPAAPASSSSLSFQNNSHHHQQQQRSEFPATTLTRVPYQPPPAMQANMPTQPLHHQPATSFSSHLTPSASANTSSNLPQKQQHHQSIHPAGAGGRRPSVVAAAQNLLGDKLDDFTEKLAFIKKNIIMSMDSDGEDAEEFGADQNNHYYNTSSNNMMKLSNSKNRQSATLSDSR